MSARPLQDKRQKKGGYFRGFELVCMYVCSGTCRHGSQKERRQTGPFFCLVKRV